MRKKIMLMVSAMMLTIAGNASETQKVRLKLPSRDKKEAQERMVDSLLQVIADLQAELTLRDTQEMELEEALEDETEAVEELVGEEFTPEQTDSLLGEWYARKQAETFQSISEYDMDSLRFTTNVPDSVLIDRLGRMNSFITLPFNETVKNYMILYSEKRPRKTEQLLGLGAYYFPIFEEVFDRYDMPLELKYMAVIESALNPLARSRAGAHGMWQFMYRTAKLYGLHINSFVDERLDVEKSADAAARYLQDAYNIFGDWALAISSYNCGAGNVNKAIRRSGGRRDFWSIYPYLPRETRGYVPAFVGAMYAMTYYKEYGLVPEQLSMPAHADTFEIRRNLHFKQVSELLGTPMEVIKELNPQYTHDIVPGNEGTYLLRLPYSYTNAFLDAGDSLYRYKADTLLSEKVLKSVKNGGNGESIRYRVRSGDNLSKIGARYHVGVAQLKKWNHLSSNNLRIGQMLTIYPRGYVTPSGSTATAKANAPAKSSPAAKNTSANAPTAKGSAKNANATANAAKGGSSGTANATRGGTSAQSGTASGEYTTYTVKEGDSFYTIAKNYPGVSAQNIMSFNGISSNKIRPGMKLKIPRP